MYQKAKKKSFQRTRNYSCAFPFLKICVWEKQEKKIVLWIIGVRTKKNARRSFCTCLSEHLTQAEKNRKQTRSRGTQNWIVNLRLFSSFGPRDEKKKSQKTICLADSRKKIFCCPSEPVTKNHKIKLFMNGKDSDGIISSDPLCIRGRDSC